MALLVAVFAGLFFLGHHDSASPYFRPGIDFELSSAARWLLFLLVLLPNLAFFLRLVSRLLGYFRAYFRIHYPRCYLACCLCFSRRLLSEELREDRRDHAKLTVVQQIDSVIAELEAFRTLYESGNDFADKSKFEKLLGATAHGLSKINRFKE